MSDALVFRRQFHIVTIGPGQIVVVTYHCLIDTILKPYVYHFLHIGSRETTFRRSRSCLRHVA